MPVRCAGRMCGGGDGVIGEERALRGDRSICRSSECFLPACVAVYRIDGWIDGSAVWGMLRRLLEWSSCQESMLVGIHVGLRR